jgi:hypothetical protein
MAGLPSIDDIEFGSEVIPFKNGKGKFITIKTKEHGANVGFRMHATAPMGVSTPFDGAEQSTRRNMVLVIDNDADAAANDGLSVFLRQVSDKLLNHMADHAAEFFPKIKPSREVMLEQGYQATDVVNGHEQLKVRVDLAKAAVRIPDPDAADDSDDALSALSVTGEDIPRVCERNAHVASFVEAAWVWLNDNMSFGISFECREMFVRPPAAAALPSVEEMLTHMDAISVGSEVRKYSSGAGRYTPVSHGAGGGYLKYRLSDSVGASGDTMRVAFAPSAGPENATPPEECAKLDFSFDVPRDSAFSRWCLAMNDKAVQAALQQKWYPGKSEAALKLMLRSPYRDNNPNYNPTCKAK